MFVIKAVKRDLDVKLNALRKSGKIPAVFYGAGQTTTSISIPNIEFKKVWKNAGESSAVKVAMEGGDIDVLIHEVQVDPVTEEPIHVDFLAIDMKKKIKVKIPLLFEGISNAVKNGTGNLVKVLHEIEVEALPADLVQNIAVDISPLEGIDSQILVSDIKLPVGIVAITSGSEVVASIIAQVEEKEEVVAPVDLSAIEVEKKGKKEEESAPAETAPAGKEPAKEEKGEKK